MRKVALPAFLFVLAAAASAEAVAQGGGMRTYVNERFGVAVDYPDILEVRDPPPANGDGQTFWTRDGRARLSVFGFLNADRETPRQLMEARRQPGTDYSYAQAARGWFVLSGTRRGRISYLRCLIGGKGADVVGCLDLEYPAAEAAAWHTAIGRMSRSLRLQAGWQVR